MTLLLAVGITNTFLWCVYWLSLACLVLIYVKAMLISRWSIPRAELVSLLMVLAAAAMYATYYAYFYIEHRPLYVGEVYSEFSYELTGTLLALVSIAFGLRVDKTRRTPIIIIGFVMVAGFCDVLGMIPYPESKYELAAFLLVGVPLLSIFIWKIGFVGYRRLVGGSSMKPSGVSHS